MGVKHFYLWYSRHFVDCLSATPQVPVDVLALDLNGLFHPVAQKVFQYGNYAPPPSYLNKGRRPSSNVTPNMFQLFREVCEKIEFCRKICKPRKKLVLCVDGVAGMGKMNQQRQRRFRTAKAVAEANQSFNPNAFTPGTKLMDHLTKYIDWYVRTMMSYSAEWKDLEVIFSNEKVPGEGEHKIMHYIRKHGVITDSYCIYGMDADLMMLGMVLPVEKVLIAREPEEGFVQFVDVRSFKKEILQLMRWPSGSTAHPTTTFSEKDAVHDFIVLCFLVGNDFLPTIPSLTIMDGGIDKMMTLYKDLGKKNGHLTMEVRGKKTMKLRLEPLREFFKELGSTEKEMIEAKYNGMKNFHEDPLVLQNLDADKKLDMEKFKIDYYEKNFPTGVTRKEIVHRFLDGMQWTLTYYKIGIADWTWFFPYMYGPFLSDFTEYIPSYKHAKFEINQPVPPFLQLMAVLPSSSADLVPTGLSELMTQTDSPLLQFYPTEFEVDLAGKKRDWEAIVLLPPIDVDRFMTEYQKHVRNVTPNLLRRNMIGKNFVYLHDRSNPPQVFVSFYGNIEQCTVKVQPIVF